jgi:aminopeptidase
MVDPRIGKLAELLVDYSVAVQPDQKVLVWGPDVASSLLKEVYARVLRVGAEPFLMVEMPWEIRTWLENSSDEQLQNPSSIQKHVLETFDSMIRIKGDANTKNLTTVDSQKMGMYQIGRGKLSEVYLRRSSTGEMNWSLTIFPTNAYAQDAEMSLEEYEDFVFKACMPDMDDPIGYWKSVSARQDKIVDWLMGKKDVHVIGPDTDLRLSIDGRKFINCDCHKNVPDGEVFTGPVEDSVEGHVRYSYPAIYQGHEVTGVELWFEKGRVVKATADKNEEFLLQMLNTSESSRYLGEFAIGTNDGIDKFTGQILFDEKIGGSFHMAVGAGYPETGSKNKAPIHWDMICDLRDGGEIWVDGDLLYKNGKFAIEF